MDTYKMKDILLPLTESKIQKIIDFSSECLLVWRTDGTMIDVSLATLDFFGIPTKVSFYTRNHELLPKYQPDGKLSEDTMLEWIKYANVNGHASFDYLYKKLDDRYIYCHIDLYPGEYLGQKVICAFVFDKAANETKDENTNAPFNAPSISDRTHVILDAVPIGCWLFDSLGEVIDCNRHAVDIFEMSSKAELNSTSVEDCLPPYQKNGEVSMVHFKKIFVHAIKEGLYKGPITISSKSGRELHCELTLTRVEYKNEAAIMLSLRETSEDFETIKQMKLERAARQKLQAMIDSSPLLCVVYSKEGKVIEVNQVAEALFRIPDKQIYIDRPEELSEKYQPCGNLSMEIIPQKLQLAFETGWQQFEWMHRTLDGEPLPCEVTLVRIHIDDEDVVLAYKRDMRDYYKLKEYQDSIRVRIRAMLDSSPIVCAIFDKDANVLEVNQAVVDMLGLSKREDYIDRFLELHPEFQPDGALSCEKRAKMFDLAFETGSAHFEWMHQSLDGMLIPCEVHKKRVRLEDQDVVIVYLRDLRKEKDRLQKMVDALVQELFANEAKARAEIAEEGNRAKSRFLARMSHEIRTPITAVLGISEIQLQNQNMPTHIEEAFAMIHNSATLLLGIVKDILDLSKIEADKMEIMQEKYEMAGMINDVAHLSLGYLGNKDIKFNLYVDENLPTHLIGDSIRIMQIMNNLLSNAFKYTESGSINLSLESNSNELNKDELMLIISVSDTGLGMTSEQLNALTNSEYMRFHEGENRFISGTGLGMPIVHNLAQIMNAHVDMVSNVGKGTNIVVRIPQKITTSTPLGKNLAQSLQKFEIVTTAGSKKFKFEPEPMPYGRVLVVDDVEANLYVAKGLLAFYDLQIETCNSGAEAINKIKAGKIYDIVFMDHMMPGLDGIQTMDIIRELGYNEPLIVLTANALIGQAEEFIKCGFDDFLSKPIQTKNLNTVLIKYIKDKQSPDVIESTINTAKSTNTHICKNINDFQQGDDLQETLRKEFVREQKNAFNNISNAINAGNTKTAHLLTHTLKGVAGLIYENTLVKISSDIEHLLKNEELPTSEQLSTLEKEITQVLESIGESEPVQIHANKVLDKTKALALFDKLVPLLEANSTESLKLVDELKKMPETMILVRQIEDFDFEMALKNIRVLQDILVE